MKTSATRQIFRLQTLVRTLVAPKFAARSTSMSALQKKIDNTIAENKVVVYSKTYCPFCVKAKNALKNTGIEFLAIEIENDPEMEDIQNYLLKLTKGRSVPRVFINGKFFGGGDETAAGAKNNQLKKAYDGQ